MQQINLYQPELRPKTVGLNAGRSLLCCLVFFAGLIALQLHLTQRQARQVAEVEALETKKIQLQDAIKQWQQPDRDNAQQRSQQAIDSLQRSVRDRENIIALISAGSLGNNTGFSQHLREIRERTPAAVTLATLVLADGGHRVEMRGTSANAPSIPEFIVALHQSEVFAASHFGSLTVQRQGSRFEFVFDGDNPTPRPSLGFHPR